MATTLQKWYQAAEDFFKNDKYLDPRVKEFYFVSNPIPMAVIIVIYLYFCLKVGPRFMEGRKPYELRKVLIVYNFTQVLISLYITYYGIQVWMQNNLLCEPIDYTINEKTTLTLHLCYCYVIAKITELLDTVFFVLRKKYNQVSFLHVFHHTVMPIFTGVGLRYYGGGHATLLGLLNSFVHVVMYSYYLLAGMGPQYQKYLWWKRHVTDIQLIQFVIVFIHNFIPLFTSCSYPKYLHVLIMAFASTFIYMFGQFYIQNYLKNRRHRERAEEMINNGKIKLN